MLIKRSVVVRACAMFAALLGFASAGNAQIHIDYGRCIHPMMWDDLHRWLGDAHLSDGQLRFLIRTYDDYLESAEDLREQYLHAALDRFETNWNVDQSVQVAINYRKDRRRAGQQAVARIKRIDDGFFNACLRVMAEEQAPIVERARKRRRRSQFHDAIGNFCDLTGRKYVELNEVLLDDRLPAEAKITLDQYESRLSNLTQRLFTELCDREVQYMEEVLAKRGDIPMRDLDAFESLDHYWGSGVERALRIASSMDELTDATLRSLDSSLTDAQVLKLHLRYFDQAFTSRRNTHDRVSKLFDARNNDANEDAKQIFDEAFSEIGSHVREHLRERSTLLKRRAVSLGATQNMFRVADQVEYRLNDRVLETEKAMRTLLQQVDDAQWMSQLAFDMRWDTEEIQRKRKERLDALRLHLKPAGVGMERPWLTHLLAIFDLTWNDAQEQAYQAYLSKLDEIDRACDSVFEDACRDRMLAADSALLAVFVPSDYPRASDVLETLEGFRRCHLHIAGVRLYTNIAGVAVDLVDVLVQYEVRIPEAAELSALALEYGKVRLGHLRKFIPSGNPTPNQNHSPAMEAIARQNAEFLADLRPLLEPDQHDAIWMAYWKRAQPRIAIDDEYASDRFKAALADPDALPQDLRVEIGSRWLTYQQRHRALTDQMLDYVDESFAWEHIGGYQIIKGRTPWIPGSEVIDFGRIEELQNLYLKRRNLNALENAYLDTFAKTGPPDGD